MADHDPKGREAEVAAQNEEMRAAAEAEIAAGSTCPVPRLTASMSDEEFAAQDDAFVRADPHLSEGEIADLTPGVQAAYRRLKDKKDES